MKRYLDVRFAKNVSDKNVETLTEIITNLDNNIKDGDFVLKMTELLKSHPNIKWLKPEELKSAISRAYNDPYLDNRYPARNLAYRLIDDELIEI